MKRIFDASAILAAIFLEPGAEQTAQLWADGENYVSAVNYSEVVAKLNERGMPEAEILIVMQSLPLTLITFDGRAAVAVGLLRSKTKSLGLSLGDRACLAVGHLEQAQIITADQLWNSLKEYNVTLVR
jgi:ribonuclease VapC